jgi:hypothetical protein
VFFFTSPLHLNYLIISIGTLTIVLLTDEPEKLPWHDVEVDIVASEAILTKYTILSYLRIVSSFAPQIFEKKEKNSLSSTSARKIPL